jgi:hypothetical protein
MLKFEAKFVASIGFYSTMLQCGRCEKTKNKTELSFLVWCHFLTHHLQLDIYFGDSILGISNCLLHHTAQHHLAKGKIRGNNII